MIEERAILKNVNQMLTGVIKIVLQNFIASIIPTP